MALEGERRAIADSLYERCVRGLEDGHRGQFAAVSRDGNVLLRDTVVEALREGKARFGRGNNFVFKIGERVVGAAHLTLPAPFPTAGRERHLVARLPSPLLTPYN